MLGLNAIRKLFAGLSRTREDLTRRIIEAYGGERLDEDRLEAMEEALISADVGVATASRVIATVREHARGRAELGAQELREILTRELTSSLEELKQPATGSSPKGLATASVDTGGSPHVILVVGVNGGGKTTTVAKLAARLREEGRSVLLAAADTFRAAATEQLLAWGKRAGVEVIRHAHGADPSAVVFDAARAAVGRRSDVLIVDTAGRLHTKSNLMQELEKIARVVGREIPGAPHEVLLALDATTGQNGLSQAREFARSVPVTGLVVTKLDGTARGGVALAIARELGIPIRYVGIGEAIDDLLEFDPRAFVASLIGESVGGRAEGPR